MLRSLIVCGFLAFSASAITATPGYSQTSPGVNSGASASPSAQRRKALEEKERADQLRRQAIEQSDMARIEARSRKMKACKAGAKQKKLHLLKRRRFIKKCMVE